MPSNIVLKNAAAANVTFAHRNTAGGTNVFVSAGTNLLDSKKLELTLKEGGQTNRVVGKLSVPSTGINPETGLVSVQWTEVGSFDLSSVKVASTLAQDDFLAMFASLADHAAVKSLFKTGASI